MDDDTFHMGLRCYPCAVYGHECVLETSHERKQRTSVRACPSGCMRFDVALWREWPSLFPEYIGVVDALHAFEAVVSLMRMFGVSSVACAVASTLPERSMVYTAFRVRLVLDDDGVGRTRGVNHEGVASIASERRGEI